MQVCSQCTRVNPREASYCYHDGALLAGHRGGGPINAGAAPFPSQFVFPTGEACRNFDQLAMTCQQQWKPAVELLKQGYLGTFFGGLGRADLAMAAQEAARFPDEDRGLDQLLAKLPTNVLQPPKVKAEPTEINLGQIAMGTDRATELHLSNLGMRLAYGAVVSDCKWLTLGEAPGNPQKLFQFGADTIIPVHIRGKDLKAGNKPLVGHLTVESNGGTCTVTVKADVPITPFTDGTLAGALTPRQIAEKAKANPKEAAPLFEKGVVGDWYAKNGWTYPVQGPNASGLGAVQQFFEALGLAKAPRIEVKTKSISLRGDGGKSLQATIEVGSPDPRPVYAHAVCDQPWVDVGKVKMSRNTASITVSIASVPNRPGEKLEAKITVTGNGNQRAVVPLTLEVGAANPFAELAPVEMVPPPLPGAAPYSPLVLTAADDVPVLAAAVTTSPPPIVMPLPNQAVSAGPPPLLPTLPGAAPSPAADGSIALHRRRPIWIHLLPLGALAVLLLGFLLRDLIATGRASAEASDIPPFPRLGVFFDWQADVKDQKKEKGVGETMSWGLVARESQNQDSKRLTFHHRGITNQTMVMINGQPRHFAIPADGRWEEKPTNIGDWGGKPDNWTGGKKATWIFFNEQIALTQDVKLIAGEPVEVGPEDYKRLIDTCLVSYRFVNKDAKKSHVVGLRFLLDTYIGKNDGVPFLLPGEKTLMSTSKDFVKADAIPDSIQAYENNDITAPGTIAQLNLRPDANKFEVPDRVSLTAWPGHNYPKWAVPLENIGQDSAIVLYWEPKELLPGKSREFAFTYGLGNLSAKGGKLGIVSPPINLTVGAEFFITALVRDPQPNQTATIDLHNSLKLLSNYPATQPVPPTEKEEGKAHASRITWRVRATAASPNDRGSPIIVNTSDGLTQTRFVRIRSSSIF